MPDPVPDERALADVGERFTTPQRGCLREMADRFGISAFPQRHAARGFKCFEPERVDVSGLDVEPVKRPPAGWDSLQQPGSRDPGIGAGDRLAGLVHVRAEQTGGARVRLTVEYEALHSICGQRVRLGEQ
ncbi:MAG TPA: hypothetical protein VF070_18660 [Streptosporangiaceae bacterium]